VARDSSVKLVVSKGPDLVTVPDVKGLTLAQANTRLEQAGLTPGEVSGNARRPVASTDPAAGTSVRRGSRVDLRLG
jgi:serine/threonine-protein kinase